jgi:hypothetical protein
LKILLFELLRKVLLKNKKIGNSAYFLLKDELNQIAVLRTKYVIMGSDICRCMIKDYSNKTNQDTTLKTLADIIHLDQIPKVDYP